MQTALNLGLTQENANTSLRAVAKQSQALILRQECVSPETHKCTQINPDIYVPNSVSVSSLSSFILNLI
jgi:hypothetical protein